MTQNQSRRPDSPLAPEAEQIFRRFADRVGANFTLSSGFSNEEMEDGPPLPEIYKLLGKAFSKFVKRNEDDELAQFDLVKNAVVSCNYKGRTISFLTRNIGNGFSVDGKLPVQVSCKLKWIQRFNLSILPGCKGLKPGFTPLEQKPFPTHLNIFIPTFALKIIDNNVGTNYSFRLEDQEFSNCFSVRTNDCNVAQEALSRVDIKRFFFETENIHSFYIRSYQDKNLLELELLSSTSYFDLEPFELTLGFMRNMLDMLDELLITQPNNGSF
jgi:hypothetical protein